MQTNQGPTTPVPVRLRRKLRNRIERAARVLGSNASSVIRFAIVQQLAEIESGKITIRNIDDAA